MATQPSPRYQPFYCEENAWWLCADPALGPGGHHVVFVLSRAGRCPMLHQHAAPPGHLIAWDYHVVVVDTRGRVWDQDSRLPLPSPGVAWLDRTFALAGRLPVVYAPLLRVIPAADYRASFASDRGHMRDRNGRFTRPPPPWAPIGAGSTLRLFLDPAAREPGRLLQLRAARRWLVGLDLAAPPSGARSEGPAVPARGLPPQPA
jgi:protein N-terminal glutamine amidohydrolase